MKRSTEYIRYLTSIEYWRKGLVRVTSCWWAQDKAGAGFTEEELKLLREALQHFNQAQRLFKQVWAKRLGETLVEEIL